MTSESKHLSERIDRSADEVYDYASDPANLPEWAPGLGSSVEQVDGRWFVDTPMGRVGFAFAPRNTYGVLDHDVTLPSGEIIYNPLRVIRRGPHAPVTGGAVRGSHRGRRACVRRTRRKATAPRHSGHHLQVPLL